MFDNAVFRGVVTAAFAVIAGIALVSSAAAQSSTSLTLTAGTATSLAGAPVTIAATVIPADAGGKVTFFSGQTILGTRSLAPGSGTTDSTAFTTSLLPAGVDRLRAIYEGSASYAPSQSAVLLHTTVQPLLASTFTASASALAINDQSPRLARPLKTVASALAAADFNDDGIPDLVVVGGMATVYLGDGGGAFHQASVIDYGADASPLAVSVAVGDFDGDGHADFVVTCSAGPDCYGVHEYLGNGDGTFRTGFTDLGVLGVQSVAVADANADGVADLFVLAQLATEPVSYGLLVVMGNGDGSFQPASMLVDQFTQLTSVSIGDFDGDGRPDAAMSEKGTSTDVVVVFGNASHTRVVLPIDAALGTAIADVNGDGSDDVVVASTNGTVSVYLSDGHGAFPTSTSVQAGARGDVIVAGDVDGDGLVDLVVINTSNTVSVLTGNGDGTFLPLGQFAAASPDAIIVGEFNGDGMTDLAVGSEAAGDVRLWTGAPLPSDLEIEVETSRNFVEGSGSAQYQLTVRNVGLGTSEGAVDVTDLLPQGLVATNVRGTGWLCGELLAQIECLRTDLLRRLASYPPIIVTMAVASGEAPQSVVNTVRVSNSSDGNLLNNMVSTPTELFAPTMTTLTVPGSSSVGEAVTLAASVSPAAATGTVAFFDGVSLLGEATVAGGHASIMTTALPSGTRTLRAAYAGFNGYQGSASLYLSQTVAPRAAGGFTAPSSYAAGIVPVAVATGDFNGDGHVDVVTADFVGDDVSVLLGRGDGTLGPAAAYGGFTRPTSVAVGDVNGDGFEDVAVADQNGVVVLLGHGDGTFNDAAGSWGFVFPGSSSIPSVNFVRIADFDNDGVPDLAVSDSVMGVVHVMHGFGNGTFETSTTTLAAGGAIAVGDLNNDGAVDLVAIGSHSDVLIFFGNGDATFQLAADYAIGAVGDAIDIGDITGDGQNDIAIASAFSGQLTTLLLNSPSGTFFHTTATPVTPLAIRDLDGDGVPDIAAADVHANALDVLIGNGDGTFLPAIHNPTGSTPSGVAIADFNEDGLPDVVTANSGSNDVSILLGTAAPDLTIAMHASGQFSQGQATGASYAITIRNGGGAPTTGTVTVTDLSPSGLTATSISGPGWACDAQILSCSRSDVLPASASYPDIGVGVAVAANASGSVTNAATVSGGGEHRTNNDTASVSTMVLPDTTPPVLSFLSELQGGPAVRGLVVDATGPDGASVSFNLRAIDNVDGDVVPQCTPPDHSTFPLGQTNVVCTATDAHGNTASRPFFVEVVDDTPPVFSAAAPVTIEATSPAGAALRYTPPTATDAVSGSHVTIVCTPGPGQTVAVDQSVTMACTATDQAGNVAQVTFTATVRDTTPPVVTTSGNVTAQATMPGGAIVTFSATATDLVDGVLTPSCSRPSGSTFAIGTTTVTCTAVDAHRNAGSASFIVTVLGPQTVVDNVAAAGASSGLSTSVLQAALQNFSTGNTKAACQQLDAFMHQTEAQSGKAVSAAEAAALVAEITNAKGAMGCN